jgi:sugar phosphate isomerase/epimerase
MRIGLCTSAADIPLAEEAGADFVELSVASDLIPDRPDAEFDRLRDALLASPLPIEAFNSFVRRLRIVGPDVDRGALETYVETALRRASAVGGKVIVLGSAGARQVPDGFPRERARTQLVDFLNICRAAAQRHAVSVAIEPLCRAESNFIQTVAEADVLAREVNSPWIGVLADTFHMEQENEALDAIVAAAPRVLHVHTAGAGRRAPNPTDTMHFRLLATCQWLDPAVRLSIECGWEDFPRESRVAVAHLRRCARTGAG